MEVLLVCAEEPRATGVSQALEAGGHRVSRTGTPAEGLAWAGKNATEAVLYATDDKDSGLGEFRTSLESRAKGRVIPVLPAHPADVPEALVAALARLESPPPAKATPTTEAVTRTILLVDDREANRRRLASQFAGHGWLVLEAVDSKSTALQIIDHRIDCVMINAMLSGRTSHGIVRSAAEIRKVHPSPYAIVVMADMEDSATASRMIESGADDVVGRMIGASLLRRRLESALHLRDVLRENRRLKERLASLESAGA